LFARHPAPRRAGLAQAAELLRAAANENVKPASKRAKPEA
jgi:hypothetical protein